MIGSNYDEIHQNDHITTFIKITNNHGITKG
jgi:hypothetical protein